MCSLITWVIKAMRHILGPDILARNFFLVYLSIVILLVMVTLYELLTTMLCN